jgi:hypothetical protein
VALNRWVRYGADRAARAILQSPVSAIEATSRSCPGPDIIEVTALVLVTGERVSVRDHWQGGRPAVREFLRVIHKSACKRFAAVSGPNAGNEHLDHFRLEATAPQSCR